MDKKQEIERKFLVNTLPNLMNAKRTVIRQGYLTQSGDSVEVRLRQKGGFFFLTVKSGEGLVRNERETEITQSQFDSLWPVTQGQRVEKERWIGVIERDLYFELDIFEGILAPLVLVEVEFHSEEAANSFEVPTWFGREVTMDHRFKNKYLAMNTPTVEAST